MTRDTGDGPTASEEPTWPPRFPHSRIDELLTRLESSSTMDHEDALELLQSVVREAERLRTAVVRLSVERLSAAEREAHEIVTTAQTSADSVRSLALQTVGNRLDEAEQISRAMRMAFLSESRIGGDSERSRRDSAGGPGQSTSDETTP